MLGSIKRRYACLQIFMEQCPLQGLSGGRVRPRPLPSFTADGSTAPVLPDNLPGSSSSGQFMAPNLLPNTARHLVVHACDKACNQAFAPLMRYATASPPSSVTDQCCAKGPCHACNCMQPGTAELQWACDAAHSLGTEHHTSPTQAGCDSAVHHAPLAPDVPQPRLSGAHREPVGPLPSA